MTKPKFIYVLPEFVNKNNLKNIRTQTTDIYEVSFHDVVLNVVLTETNSLIEDEYCLNFQSSKFILESVDVNESMIHHHKKGHSGRHLQFKLSSNNEELRIFLDNLDEDDYIRCIKGFLYLSKELLLREQHRSSLTVNLIEYFFNEDIDTLFYEKQFLLNRIKLSFEQGQIFLGKDVVGRKDLLRLHSEDNLSLFLDFV